MRKEVKKKKGPVPEGPVKPGVAFGFYSRGLEKPTGGCETRETNPLRCYDYLPTTGTQLFFFYSKHITLLIKELFMRINFSDTLKSTRGQSNWQVHQSWRRHCLH